MSVTLPGDGATVATATVNGAEQQIVQVSNLPATQAIAGTVALDAVALAAIAGAATPANQPVSGAFFQATQPVSGPATDAQLRATPLPVSGSVAVSNMVAQGLTDAQLRFAAVPVSGPATDGQLRATPLPVSMSNTLALTDTQLRATPLPVNGAVSVISNGLISTSNSTAVALGISGVFTGAWEDITEFADIRITAFADQPGAVDGLQIQQSTNGINADISDNYTLPANTGRPFSVASAVRFFRIVYTNGVTAQTAFRLQSKLNKTYAKGSSVRPQDARSRENDMEEVLGYAMHFDGTNWNMQRGTIANGLSVDVTRLPALVAGAAVIGALVANQSVNKAQINGVAPLMGNGVSGTGSQRVNIASDNTAFAVNQGAANAAPWLANPLTSQITAEASSAKIATGNGATITNASFSGALLFLNASVVSGTTPSLTVRVQMQDPVSLAWVDIPGAAYVAITAVTAAPVVFLVDLGSTPVVNAAVNYPLPRTWRLAWVISGTTPSFTFSVGAQYLL